MKISDNLKISESFGKIFDVRHTQKWNKTKRSPPPPPFYQPYDPAAARLVKTSDAFGCLLRVLYSSVVNYNTLLY